MRHRHCSALVADGDTELSHARRSSDRVQSGEPRIRVLAVDDDRSYLAFLKLLLKRAGFDVQVASSGSAAVEKIRSGAEVDLLLIDLSMPEMDGIETVQQLRTDSNSMLFAMLLTGHDGAAVKVRALDSGLDDFISKTASETEIVAKIRSAARRLEMERRLTVKNAELQTLALTDDLTGVANRRAMFSAGQTMLSSGRRVSAIMLDIDQFKQINDRHGHLTGDRVLADIARCLKETTRVGDLIARYGGDEFVVLLPDTGHKEARVIARRIARGIAALAWQTLSGGPPLRVTIALGVSTAARDAGADFTDLLGRCDTELLRAKKIHHSGAPRRRPAHLAEQARLE
jgi:two-component system, cell cycle response regulator